MSQKTWSFRRFEGPLYGVDMIETVAEDYGSKFFDPSNMRFHASKILDGASPVLEGLPEGIRASLFVTSEKKCFDDYTRVYTLRCFVEVAKDMNPDYGGSKDSRFGTTSGHLIQNRRGDAGEYEVGSFSSSKAAHKERQRIAQLPWPEVWALFSDPGYKYPLQRATEACACCKGRGYVYSDETSSPEVSHA